MPRSPLRRSLLYVPGSTPKMIAKAFASDADAVILDLEDAVSPEEKDAARQNVAEALDRSRPAGKEVIVRVNAVDSHLGLEDLLAIVPRRPDTLIIPKAEPAAMITADTLLGAIERHLGLAPPAIGLIALIETARAIAEAAGIAAASGRIDGLQFGAEDLTRDLGIVRTSRGDELQYARSVLVFAGRARRIDILDTPFPDFADLAGLQAEGARAKALGMSGKTCIHPSQIAVVNRLFTPAEQEVAQARRVVEAFDRATGEGRGACTLDGRMIDHPIAERARQLIARADLIEAAEGRRTGEEGCRQLPPGGDARRGGRQTNQEAGRWKTAGPTSRG